MKHRILAINLNGDVFPTIGNTGPCAVVEKLDSLQIESCGELGIFIAETYEMSQPGHQNIRIRCVCAEHGSETTYCCIKCREILHDWSPTHTNNECDLNIIENVMGI